MNSNLWVDLEMVWNWWPVNIYIYNMYKYWTYPPTQNAIVTTRMTLITFFFGSFGSQHNLQSCGILGPKPHVRHVTSVRSCRVLVALQLLSTACRGAEPMWHSTRSTRDSPWKPFDHQCLRCGIINTYIYIYSNTAQHYHLDLCIECNYLHIFTFWPSAACIYLSIYLFVVCLSVCPSVCLYIWKQRISCSIDQEFLTHRSLKPLWVRKQQCGPNSIHHRSILLKPVRTKCAWPSVISHLNVKRHVYMNIMSINIKIYKWYIYILIYVYIYYMWEITKNLNTEIRVHMYGSRNLPRQSRPVVKLQDTRCIESISRSRPLGLDIFFTWKMDPKYSARSVFLCERHSVSCETSEHSVSCEKTVWYRHWLTLSEFYQIDIVWLPSICV